jgi:putative SOS response-associated peptidase YedK
MPLVLAPRDHEAWLMGTADEATRLLAANDDVLTERAQDLTLTPVSTWVNDVKHDDPRCLEPYEAPAQSAFTFR